jgi:hypothetical protein
MADKVTETVPVPYSNSKKLKLTYNADGMVEQVDGFIHEELVCTHKLNEFPISKQDAIEKYKEFTRF